MREIIETYSVIVLPILYGLGSVLLLNVGHRARKMLKSLTLEDVTEFAIKFIEKIANKPTVLAAFIKTVSSLDVSKKAFDSGKVLLISQIHSLESQIMSIEDKLNMGVYEGDARTKAIAMISKLKQDIAELEKINAQTDA